MINSHQDVVETGRDQLFSVDELAIKLAHMINSGEYFQENVGVKGSISALLKASTSLEKSQDFFYENLEKLVKSTDSLEVAVKKSTSRAKDSAHKMADSLKKVDAAVNISKLEQQVSLLERAVDAMERLGQLQQTGKLDKILQAIK